MPIRTSTIVQPYSTYTHADPFAPKRWLHKKLFSDCLKLLDSRDHSAVLDYGSGDGLYLLLCRQGIS